MKITSSLRDLMRAQDQDREFPYMDFLGAFLLVEKWAKASGHQTLRRLSEADSEDLLGLPLGESMDDLKLGYVLSLLRSHAQEIVSQAAAKQSPVMN